MLLQTNCLRVLRKAKDRVAMDIEGLIENLETLSDTLKSKPLRESASFSDFESSHERFEAMLSDLRVVVQKSDDHDPEKLKTILENLQTVISELDELCGIQLSLLDFVSAITPVKAIKD